MDVIATVIATAFFNIIITSIVSTFIFYRYQKKIENSFAKSFLQYQTKFVRNHQKRVEALEALYNAYNALMDFYIQPLYNREKVVGSPKSQLEDFRMCYANNSLYFSQDEIWTLESVYHTVTDLSPLAYKVDKIESHDKGMIDWINSEIRIADSDISPIRIEDPNKELFVDQLIDAFKNQAKKLKKLYMTVTAARE
jgi:hypothetical protein